ncbi:MAG: hypothetical protein IKI05_03570 [Bacteroidaceae bacterium]|nr:hypothetical protein [Bacteroidaceae bacterium]
MNFKENKGKRPKRRSSYLLSEEQFEWLKRMYPHFNNKDLSLMLFQRFGVEMSPVSIKDMAKRNVWHKSQDEITRERRKNAIKTNNKRWGYATEED